MRNLVHKYKHGNSHSGIEVVFRDGISYDSSIQKHIHLTGIIRVCNIFQLLPLNLSKNNNNNNSVCRVIIIYVVL